MEVKSILFLFCSSLTLLTHFTSVQHSYIQDSDLSSDECLQTRKHCQHIAEFQLSKKW